MKFAILFKISLLLTVFMVFSVYKTTLQLNNIKTRISMDTKIVVCVEAIIYLLSNLHFTFNFLKTIFFET